MAKYCRAGQATDDNMAHARCMLGSYGYKHDSERVTVIALPRQQCLHECASKIHYMYIACLVNVAHMK